MTEWVFVLRHNHVIGDGVEDVKIIGVYRTRRAAKRAIARLASKPGFAEHAGGADAMPGDDEEGFHITRYALDDDHWVQGYVVAMS